MTSLRRGRIGLCLLAVMLLLAASSAALAAETASDSIGTVLTDDGSAEPAPDRDLQGSPWREIAINVAKIAAVVAALIVLRLVISARRNQAR